MGLAAGHGASQLQPATKAALATALTNNGVANPDATLKAIRTMAMHLEKSAPDLSHVERQNVAILHAAESDLVAKVNSWFDQTMDRTSQRFTASTRVITFAGAFIVAFGLQVDTPSLVNRLAADDALRAAFVKEAKAVVPADADGIDRNYRAFLAENGIIKLPSAAGWKEGFASLNLFGVLLTALLLSLGAPFWYSALGRLLQLRSVLAAKDDEQRAQRQSSGPASAVTTPASRLAIEAAAGERGDLAAIG